LTLDTSQIIIKNSFLPSSGSKRKAEPAKKAPPAKKGGKLGGVGGGKKK